MVSGSDQASHSPVAVLAVGDPRREQIGRAIRGALIVSVVFVVFSLVTKRARLVGVHLPWQADPYDAVVSFTVFFVPLIAACCLARVTVCKKSEPLPVVRARDILRGCRVAAGAAAFTLMFDWVGVAVGASRIRWNGVSVAFAGLLAAASIAAAKVMTDVARAPVPRVPDSRDRAGQADWLGDFITVAQRQSRRLGPLGAPACRVLTRADRTALRAARRHPLLAAAATATAMGAIVIGGQSLREGYPAAAFLAGTIVFGCGMFPLLAAAGAYLGIARSPSPLQGVRRCAAHAALAACAAVPLGFGFRSAVWRLTGTHPGALAIMGMSAVTAFTAVFTLGALGLRAHPPAPGKQ